MVDARGANDNGTEDSALSPSRLSAGRKRICITVDRRLLDAIAALPDSTRTDIIDRALRAYLKIAEETDKPDDKEGGRK